VVRVEIGEVPHRALRCSAAAGLPLEERVGLWRERLGQRMGQNVRAMADVYWTALALCEAPTFRERSRLLSLMLDAMATIPRRVELWRVMLNDLGAADVLYRGILARVRTPQEARELHQALGLRTIDPGILAKLLKDAKSPEDRVAKLRAVAAQWPDDFTLQLKLLDALEDAGDLAGARALARALRARPDADARIRTAVGELYLRLAARAEGPAKIDDELEARRAFGEIVEFAPDDPTARRRLGDLLRAHGWFADAARQYQTLERLAPDDPSVSLLLAAAAEGLGKLEEAVKWTEKGGAAGSPDAEQGPARTARAFAAIYLAWGRLDAREKGRKEEEKALTARLVRVLSTELGSSSKTQPGTRVVLTWSHPELHPTLWSNALGAPMPAPEGDVTLGIGQVMMPSRGDAFVEVRIEPDEVEHAARLGAAATLTVVFDEAGEGEKIVKRQVVFARGGRAVQRFAVAGGEVREVLP
jgi:Ca-activated chloride channel family protein